ncbi:unnamed protein product [Closterium sp. NIES-64]|nr:unnamed protein product [Closterium sp. NIES-64]
MFSLSIRRVRPIEFAAWLDDLQLFLLTDSKNSTSLFDLTSGASPAPDAIAVSATRSQWLTRDAAAPLAVHNQLPLAERAHFGQHKTAKALYDALVARYSSLATTALGRLLLPSLFPDLSAFATVVDLVTHLRTSDTRYRACTPRQVSHQEPPPPPMYITLYFIVTRLPDSLTAELRLPLVGGTAAAGAGAVGVAEVEAVVGAVEAVVGAAVEEVVVVGAAGQVAPVVAAMEVVAAVVVVVAAVVAAIVAAKGVEAAAVGAAGVAPARGEALEVATGSSTVSPFCLRSSVSGLLSVGRLG